MMNSKMKENTPRKPADNRGVLIIDDTLFNRGLLSEILTDGGHEVRTAANGASGLQSVKESPPELVLLDIRMPGMDGYEVCGRLKENPATRDIPVIFISSLGEPDDKVKAFDAGGIDYVTMPFEKKEVLARVGSHIDLHRMRRRLEELVDQRTLELAAKAETLQKEIENRKKAEAQLLQSRKMEAIGALAGGIAHDFNNILHAVRGMAELIEAFDPPEKEETRGYLKQVIDGAYRASDLVDQILTYSRQTEKEKLPISLESIVSAALKLIRATLPSTIDIRINNLKIDGSVVADPTQMHQIIMNLCTNAGHAMRENGGALTVDLTPVDLDAETAERLPGLSPGRYARLAVGDTGDGIPKEIMDRIFDPYFTTKKSGEGTGMGLSVVHGIVQDHNGAITAKSVEGVGSEFIVYLPVLSEEATPDEVDVPEPVKTGAGSVLFVDDEEPVANYGHRALKRLGYDVITVTDSRKALEIFRADPGRFDLVITDMTMPNLTGLDLSREMTRIRPDIPVILCSGYSVAITPEKIKEASVAALISKPLSLHDLADLVYRFIDNKEAGADAMGKSASEAMGIIEKSGNC